MIWRIFLMMSIIISIFLIPMDSSYSAEDAGDADKLIIPRDEAWTYLYRNRFDDAAESLEGFVTDEASLFRLGYALLYSSRPEDAVAYLLKLPESSWKYYAISLAYYRNENYEKSIEYLDEYDFKPPVRLLAANLKLDALRKAERYTEALAHLEKMMDEFPNDINRRGYLLDRLRLLKKAEMEDEAEALFRNIINVRDSYATSAVMLFKAEKLPPEIYCKMADVLYQNKKYSLARSFYEKFTDSKEGKKDGKAHFRIARCNDKTGRYTIALGQYQEILTENVFNQGWASFGIVRCLRKLGRYDEALQELEKNEEYWKDNSSEPYVLWEGYEIGRETDDYALGAKFASKLAKKYPSHDLGDNGAVQAGVFYLLADDQENALEYFDFIHQSGKFTYERFMNIGRYWRNRLDIGYEPDGEILRGMPDFYEYHMTADSIHYAIEKPHQTIPDFSWDETIDSIHTILRSGWFRIEKLDQDDENLQWARFFAYWGMLSWARIEYTEFLKKNPNIHNTTAALDLFYEFMAADLTNPAYEIGLDIVQAYKRNIGEPPKYLYRLSYPIFFKDRLNELCTKSNVDPLFVLSVMRQESRYDPDATSYADARGLMQVIPKTGSKIALDLRYDNFDSQYLYDPHLSVEFGAYLLGDLLKRKGDPYAALAAYNAGENPVVRWHKVKLAKEDPLIFTEIIDFKQTRHYVRHVMENYFRYHDIWG